MKNTRLSLCMIVKDEEETIGRCLQSIKDIVDEIIIVDTGSTDRTIEICQSFGAKIEKFEWNGSFADARNYGLDKATGDWVFYLDADEEIDETDKELIFKGTHFEDYDVLTIHLVNYYGDKVDKNNTTDVKHTRFFRRSTGIRFINKIHETLNISDIPKEKVGHLAIKVLHYGYLDTIVEKKDKYERNMKMLRRQIAEGENIHWAYYYIAMEHYRNLEFQEAFDKANLSIRAFLQEMQLPPSMVYKLKYSSLIALGSFEGAWPGIEKAIDLYPDYVDLRFFKGVILYFLEDYDKALKSFEECIEMGEDNLNHLILQGVGSYQAWHYKGLCQQKLKKTEDAIVSFLQSVALEPNYHPVLESIKEVFANNDLSLGDYIKKYFRGKELVVLSKSLLDDRPK